MIASFATQIEIDGQGVAWIADTKMKLAEVVLDKAARGWSPEEIHFQHDRPKSMLNTCVVPQRCQPESLWQLTPEAVPIRTHSLASVASLT